MGRVKVVGAGLAGSECAWQLAERGVDVVLVEQNAAFAVKTVDRVCVIANGKVVHESSPQELWANEEVRKTHLGIG